MHNQTELTDSAVTSRVTARKSLIALSWLIGAIAILLIFLALIGGRTSPARTAAYQPLKAETVQAQAPVAAPATTATAGATRVHVAAKVAGVDLSNCSRIAGLSSRDGKITAHFENCAQVIWTTNGSNKAVATAEGGAK